MSSHWLFQRELGVKIFHFFGHLIFYRIFSVLHYLKPNYRKTRATVFRLISRKITFAKWKGAKISNNLSFFAIAGFCDTLSLFGRQQCQLTRVNLHTPKILIIQFHTSSLWKNACHKIFIHFLKMVEKRYELISVAV